MIRVFLVFLFFIQITNADCSLDYSILYAIQKVERHPKKRISYPYIISFNAKRDRYLAKSKLKLNWIDHRSVDCGDVVSCENTLRSLIKLNIKNLDLGAFQLNYKYHKMPLANYFSHEKSMQRACSIIEDLIKRFGINANTIAMYHSKTNVYRKRYADKFFEAFSQERQKTGSNIYYYYY